MIKQLVLSLLLRKYGFFSSSEAVISRFELATIPYDGMTIWCDNCIELHRHVMIASVEIRSELELIFDW